MDESSLRRVGRKLGQKMSLIEKRNTDFHLLVKSSGELLYF